MQPTVYEIDGQRYLTSSAVAKMLRVPHRTVLRWPYRVRRNTPFLQKIVWVRDPLTQRVYFREDIILEFQPQMVNRPKRIRR